MKTRDPAFSVVWPDYSMQVSNGYARFQQLEEFVDMTLAADGHYVKVHQFIVALASPYLKEIIKSIPVKHPVIFLNNVSYVELCQILEYIYSGVVDVPRHLLGDFMKCARALKLEGLCKNASLLPKPSESLDKTIAGYTLQGADAAAETISITSELERRIDLVKNDSNVVEDIMEVEPSFRISRNHDSVNKDPKSKSFAFSAFPQKEGVITQNNEKQDICEDIDNASIKENKVLDSIIDDNFLDSFLQDQLVNKAPESPSASAKKVLKTPPKTIISMGNMSKMGKKPITVLKKVVKRKRGPTVNVLPQLMSAEIPKKIPSIVIESDLGGHSITINKPTEVLPTEDLPLETEQRVGRSMPPLMSCSPNPIMPWTEAPNQERIQSSTTTMPQMPQIILAPNAPPIITNIECRESPTELESNIETEYSQHQQPSEVQVGQSGRKRTHDEVPLTAAEPVSSANEAVDLNNITAEERKNIDKELKGGIQQLYTVSNQGSLQMILNRFMYYPHYVAYGGHKRRWRCVDYRRLHCQAYVDTNGEKISNRVNIHSHPFHDKRILIKIQKKQLYSMISDASKASKKLHIKKKNDTEDMK